MIQRNNSSYLPIIYLLTVLLSLFIIHLSEVIAAHNHQVEIRDIEKDKPKPKKVKKKVTQQAKKTNEQVVEQQADTVGTAPSEPIPQKDSTNTGASAISDADFFSSLMEEYYSERKNARGRISRTDVVIRYYKKDKDEDKIYKLRDLGFYIHERPADNGFEQYASNAIFYGDSINREDLILIAYNLMQNGIKLQSLTLSKFHDAWKAHSVEIGTDTTSLNKKPFTAAALRKRWEAM